MTAMINNFHTEKFGIKVESNFKTRLQRFFGKASVGFNNWAFAEVTASYDVDSRLANYYNFDYDNISYF